MPREACAICGGARDAGVRVRVPKTPKTLARAKLAKLIGQRVPACATCALELNAAREKQSEAQRARQEREA